MAIRAHDKRPEAIELDFDCSPRTCTESAIVYAQLSPSAKREIHSNLLSPVGAVFTLAHDFFTYLIIIFNSFRRIGAARLIVTWLTLAVVWLTILATRTKRKTERQKRSAQLGSSTGRMVTLSHHFHNGLPPALKEELTLKSPALVKAVNCRDNLPW